MPGKLVFVAALASTAHVYAQTINLSKQTWYGAPDNSPPGASTAFSCDGRGYSAGGDGSYGNPLTCAVAEGSSLHNACELFYFPYLQKYLVMQDTCAGCSDDQIDIWIGNGNGGQSETDCEDNSPSGNGHNLVQNPGSGMQTNSNPLWSASGGCQVSNNVYSGAS